MENDELDLIPEVEIEKPKFHLEAIETYTKTIPVYDEEGKQIGTTEEVTGRILKKVWDDPEEIEKQRKAEISRVLKAELERIKEDIEQEIFGLVRGDYAEKKARAAEIVNALRVLEGKEPRTVRGLEEYE